MSADQIQQEERRKQARKQGEICPRCGQADLEPIQQKLKCPACFLVIGCCEGP